MNEQIQMLPPRSITVVEGINPRTKFDEAKLAELTESVKEHGVIEPIIVRRAGALFQLVAGERRLRAARRACLKEIPAIVRELTDAQAAEVAIVENLHRASLRPLEEAYALARMRHDLGHSVEKIARGVSKSDCYVYQMLALTELPTETQDAIEEGRISKTVAQKIAELPTVALQKKATRACLKPGMKGKKALNFIEGLKAGLEPGAVRAGRPAGADGVDDWKERLIAFTPAQFLRWQRAVGGRAQLRAMAEAVGTVLSEESAEPLRRAS